MYGTSKVSMAMANAVAPEECHESAPRIMGMLFGSYPFRDEIGFRY